MSPGAGDVNRVISQVTSAFTVDMDLHTQTRGFSGLQKKPPYHTGPPTIEPGPNI